MHFDYLPEHEMLRDATRGYLEHASPVARYRRGLTAENRRAQWREDARQSWAAMLASESQGGAGASIVEAMVLGEELGRAAFNGPFIPSNAAAAAIAGFADQTVRESILPRIASGELLATLAASAGGAPPLRVEPSSSGWRFDGTARFVQDGDIADLILLAAETPSGVSFFLLPEKPKGVSARQARTFDVSRVWTDLEFTGAPVEAMRVGDEEDARAIERSIAYITSVLAAIDSVGVAARLLDMTVSYTKERQAFGRPIASFQAIKHRCADMLIQVESARVAAWYAAVAARDSLHDADQAVSIAKFFATEAASAVAGQALQLHGGIGFTWEHDLHIFLKRAKANEMLWGSNSWHRERVAQDLAL